MKQNSLFEQGRKALLNPFTFGFLAMLLLITYSSRVASVGSTSAASVQPPPRPWTAVASTGVVDELYLNDYAFGTLRPTDFGFRANSSGLRLIARYNVTNTFDNNANPNAPNWHTLELGAVAPAASSVTAAIYQVERCSGLILAPPNAPPGSPLCQVMMTNIPAATCRTCNFAGPVDFTQYLYFVQVFISRPNANLQPRAFTLRVY
jgi:hypothetical protein